MYKKETLYVYFPMTVYAKDTGPLAITLEENVFWTSKDWLSFAKSDYIVKLKVLNVKVL